ncbi:hypothetical protein EHS25_005809 [Saitozyma podzolica]|uniref:Uncharacterized protein n=1 Tax=Saitozyma podzolica TaxID=1890683 RepID=A0A427XVB6_9TREE|nr:hypothetical protein EHS25_005809 [Saitozyma podzolica]
MSLNVTFDDFDPPIVYSNPSDWVTPDPSVNPTWYNASEEVTGVPWHEATYHFTSVPGAKASLNFTSTSLWIYGFVGPSSPSNYSITIDSLSAHPFSQSYSTQNTSFGSGSSSSSGRTLLYGTTGLTYAEHTVELTNWGSGVGLDLVVINAELGADGATLTNSTIDDAQSTVTYTGNWTSEGGDFFNGTSIYTQGPNNSLGFNFSGSGLYIFGDQVDDHGLYSIYLNSSYTPWLDGSSRSAAVATLDGRSGCGGGYKKACEKLGG